MENLLSLVNQYDYGLSDRDLNLHFPSAKEARSIAEPYFNQFVESAHKLGGAINFYVGDRKIIEIADYMFKTQKEEIEMADLIYYSGTEGIPPELHELSRRLFDIDGSAGIVRMSDGKQIILNDQADCTLKVASLADATNWTRDQYYHPQDLQDFLRRCQQELEPNSPGSIITNTYRSFTPEFGIQSQEGWMEITTRYQLFEVNGAFYQLGENVAFHDIARPTDLRN